jgi:hypothetical protein
MATKTMPFLANRQDEGKTADLWVAVVGVYFGKSALTISILPTF